MQETKRTQSELSDRESGTAFEYGATRYPHSRIDSGTLLKNPVAASEENRRVARTKGKALKREPEKPADSA
ncbi:hypothetical protein [Hydrocarboniphaga sp.]|uniref:hypothetical protein n=1 Tax=Hydrocarboniphaga sp. TaxID=2033016 RepID=UPI003D0C5EDF